MVRDGPYIIQCKENRLLCLAKMEQNNSLHLENMSTASSQNCFYAHKHPQFFLLEHEITGKYLSTCVKYASINVSGSNNMFHDNYSELFLECLSTDSDDQKWTWVNGEMITHYLDQRVVDVNHWKLERGNQVNVQLKNGDLKGQKWIMVDSLEGVGT